MDKVEQNQLGLLALLGGQPVAPAGSFATDRTTVSDADRAAVLRSLDSGAWSIFTSEEVQAFESEFADYVGGSHAVLVNSCTTAIHAALLAHDVGPSDVVAVPAYTYVGTCTPAVAAGASLVFIDVDPSTQAMSADALRAAFERWPIKAVIQAHLFGMAHATGEIAELCGSNGAAYISDCAQLLGNFALTSGLSRLGMCCYSFGESKLLRVGEGGAVVTNSAELAERVRLVRHEGEIWLDRRESRMGATPPSPFNVLYHIASTHLGLNYRPSALVAALGRARLSELNEELARIRENAECLLAGLSGEPSLQLPSGEARTWWTFPVLLDDPPHDRDTVLAALLAEGIPAGVHFPRLMNEHPVLRDAGLNSGEAFPRAKHFSDHHLVLPIFPTLNANHMHLITAGVRKVLSQDEPSALALRREAAEFLKSRRLSELCNGLFIYLRD